MKIAKESWELLLFNKIKEGKVVPLQCCHFPCDGVRLAVKLGKQTELGPHFGGNERIRWKVGKPAKSFKLQSEVRCPNCKSVFTKAIIVQKDKSKPPIIFGYESEGC